jgi:hypothetical protein
MEPMKSFKFWASRLTEQNVEGFLSGIFERNLLLYFRPRYRVLAQTFHLSK